MNERELLKTFYKQISQNNSTKNSFDISKGKFLIEFFNRNENEEFIKTDILKDNDNINIQANKGLSVPSVLYKNEDSNQDLIYLGGSEFNKINTVENNNTNTVTGLHLETLKIAPIDGKLYYDELKHVDKIELPNSIIPSIYDNNSKLLIQNISNKILSSDYENGSDYFQLEKIESLDNPDIVLESLIPENASQIFNVETLDLTDSETIIDGENLKFSSISKIEGAALGYTYSDKEIYETSNNLNEQTGKYKAGENIKLDNISNNKMSLYFIKNVEVTEGLISYDSILQLARNEVDNINDYKIEYEECIAEECKFKIFNENNENKKIIVYVPELIEVSIKEE